MYLLDGGDEVDDGLLGWLSELNVEQLSRVLENRQDALDPPWPRRLDDLARRLSTQRSVVRATRDIPTPAMQVLRAAQLGYALGFSGGVGLTWMEKWLDVQEADLRAEGLEALVDRALAWVDRSGLIRLPEALRCAGYGDYRLGEPLADMLPMLNVEQLKQLCRRIGLGGGRKQQILDRLLEFYRAGERVRALLDDAPDEAVEFLTEGAWHGPNVNCYLGSWFFSRYGRSMGQQSPAHWAADHGLLWRNRDGTGHLPLEVGLALRGPAYRLPFDPEPPRPAVAPVDAEGVAADSTAAALRFLDRLTTITEAAGTQPLPLLKTGDVGARVINKLAKDSGATGEEIRLAVELAVSAGLLTPVELQTIPPHRTGRRARSRQSVPTPALGLVPTEDFARIKADGSAALLGTILTQWWNLTAAPLADPKALRDVLGDEPSSAYAHVRRLMVRLLTELDSDTGIVDAAAMNDLVSWHAPAITPELLPALVAAVWAEAELLGVITAGAATDLAHALLGDAAELVNATQQVTSGACTTALFGSDLTAIVAGSPDAQLAAVLDRAAEREAQGAATTWRFDPASVRRALDAGQTAVELLDELSSVAEGELPQPLRYLIGDVGRRHGGVGVIEVRCVVIGDTPAVLAEIAAHRKLAKLGLRAVAETVLICDTDAISTLSALREAGYAPVRRDTDGEIIVSGQEAARTPAPSTPNPRAVAAPDTSMTPKSGPQPRPVHAAARQGPGEHAKRLLSEPTSGPTIFRRSDFHTALKPRRAESMQPGWTQLAWELEAGLPVTVHYGAPDGTQSILTVSNAELHDDSIDVWCDEYGDYRRLELDRIRPVDD